MYIINIGVFVFCLLRLTDVVWFLSIISKMVTFMYNSIPVLTRIIVINTPLPLLAIPFVSDDEVR